MEPSAEIEQPAGERRLFDGPRGTAVKILNRVERSDAYLDKLLDAELRSRELGDADKALLAEIVHGVVRWQGRLDWVLNGFFHGNFVKAETTVKNALRVGLYQVFFLDRVPHHAAVNEAVEFVKRIRGDKAANLVNAVLRNIIRSLEGIRYPDRNENEAQYLSVYYSHPLWMVIRWLERFGSEEAEKLLAVNNEVPDLTLRVNRLAILPAKFRSLLAEQRVAFEPSQYLDFFVKVRSLAGIAQTEWFRSGYFSVQDESAAFPCLLLEPRPGERVIDMCAAPGGKTAMMGEMMGNEGTIIAVDKYESRLNIIKATCERLGIRNVHYIAADSGELDVPIADKILVDAPCSGLGVLRKKPDIKWKREPEEFTRFAALQLRLLENAARLLKPGGVLVYSTCTIEPEENSRVVAEFLNMHNEFTIDNAGRFVDKSLATPDGFVETFPHRHKMDGSFAARLTKAITRR